ncbi:RGS domain-containing protein [Entamoeba marina]
MEKQTFDVFKKNSLGLLADLKSFNYLLKSLEKSVHNINKQLRSLYFNGNSIIQNEVLQFLDRTDDFRLSNLNVFENEVSNSEWYYKDIGKNMSRFSQDEIKSINEQRYDVLDPSIMLYMNNVINLYGEKASSYKILLFNVIQDGIIVPKSLSSLSTLQTLMDNRIGCMYLKKYLQDKPSLNLVNFYRSVLLFKVTTTPTVRECLNKDIYNTYIAQDSPKHINISKENIQQIKKKISNGLTNDMYDSAQKEVYESLLENGIFEQFQNSNCFSQLANRLCFIQIPTKVKTPRSRNHNRSPTPTLPRSSPVQQSFFVQFDKQACEVYVRVAKYLSEYNLVQFTDQFVNYGFTSPQLMAMMSDRDIQLLDPCEADAKRLIELIKIAKVGEIQTSKTLTKEAITKVKIIQTNFLQFCEHKKYDISNTLDFLKYIESQPIQQLNVAQIIAKAEMSFQELHSKHHIALRILRKSDSIQEVEPLLPQCQSALVALLVDDHVEEYNDAEYWKNSPRKRKTKLLSATPDLRLGNESPDSYTNSPDLRAHTPDIFQHEKPKYCNVLDESKNNHDIKTLTSTRRMTECELRKSIQVDLVGNSQVNSLENKMSFTVKSIKNELLPRIEIAKNKINSIQTEDDYNKHLTEITLIQDMKKLLEKETQEGQQSKRSVFTLLYTSTSISKEVKKVIKDVEMVECSIKLMLEKLNSVLDSISSSNILVASYDKTIQQLCSFI